MDAIRKDGYPFFFTAILKTKQHIMEKRFYIAPEIEVLEIEIEKGFADSTTKPTYNLPPFEDAGW